jgi:hypothetical protein
MLAWLLARIRATRPIANIQESMLPTGSVPDRPSAAGRPPARAAAGVLAFLIVCLAAVQCLAGEAVVLARDVQIRLRPSTASRSLGTAQPGDLFDVATRKGGRGASSYFLDERGDVWVKVQGSGEDTGFIRTDLVAINHEDFRSPRGNPLLLVNIRATGTGEPARDLWLVEKDWQATHRLGPIVGKPIWASSGDWFLFQTDSDRPVKDSSMDRTVELIEKVSTDGKTRMTLAAGSWPTLDESRREVYFYRDVDEQGVPVPPGLYAVTVEGTHLHPVFLLPERYSFWKEDGDFFVQAPPPTLQVPAGRIVFRAFDRGGRKVRFTVSLEGQLIERKSE